MRIEIISKLVAGRMIAEMRHKLHGGGVLHPRAHYVGDVPFAAQGYAIAAGFGGGVVSEIGGATETLAAKLGIKMSTLPAGKFIFQGVADVAFKGCKLAEVPFTNGKFEKLLELEPARLAAIVADPAKRLEKSLSAVDSDHKDEAEDAPMVFISHTEAEEIAKLCGKRLPNELEQERAASWTDGRKYPFGDTFDASKVTFNGKGTRSVYAHRDGASPEEILDLSGNVWEWMANPYGQIDLSDPENPNLPVQGNTFVLRGGSWYVSNAVFLRGDFRDFGDPDGRNVTFGFRFAED